MVPVLYYTFVCPRPHTTWIWNRFQLKCLPAGQVKSSSGATRRDRRDYPDPHLFLPTSLRGLYWRGLSGVGRNEEPQRGSLLP